MLDITKSFAFVRRIASEIAAGRIEAKSIEAMTDDQLAEFDADVYQQYQSERERREELLNEEQEGD